MMLIASGDARLELVVAYVARSAAPLVFVGMPSVLNYASAGSERIDRRI
jgi:hypothetical protein